MAPYTLRVPIGLWSIVVHYVGNRVSFKMQPESVMTREFFHQQNWISKLTLWTNLRGKSCLMKSIGEEETVIGFITLHCHIYVIHSR